MSEENVVLVRSYYEAVQGVFGAYWESPGSAADTLETGEVPPVGVEMLRYLHPNVEWKTALTGVTYRGYNDLARGFDQVVDAAQNYGIEVQEVSDLGGNQVLAVVEAGMRGRATDIDVKAGIFIVVTVRDGLITRMDEYLDRADALKAAGLSE
jgi:ketosteroid isomerase-like protein